MVFEKIDRSSWKRNEYFENYFTKYTLHIQYDC